MAHLRWKIQGTGGLIRYSIVDMGGVTWCGMWVWVVRYGVHVNVGYLIRCGLWMREEVRFELPGCFTLISLTREEN